MAYEQTCKHGVSYKIYCMECAENYPKCEHGVSYRVFCRGCEVKTRKPHANVENLDKLAKRLNKEGTIVTTMPEENCVHGKRLAAYCFECAKAGKTPNSVAPADREKAVYGGPPAASSPWKSRLAEYDAKCIRVTETRSNTYGPPGVDFDRATRLKAVVAECKDPLARHAMEMICVKLARLIQTPNHLDTWIDIAGYARTGVMVTEPNTGQAGIGIDKNAQGWDIKVKTFNV